MKPVIKISKQLICLQKIYGQTIKVKTNIHKVEVQAEWIIQIVILILISASIVCWIIFISKIHLIYHCVPLYHVNLINVAFKMIQRQLIQFWEQLSLHSSRYNFCPWNPTTLIENIFPVSQHLYINKTITQMGSRYYTSAPSYVCVCVVDAFCLFSFYTTQVNASSYVGLS